MDRTQTARRDQRAAELLSDFYAEQWALAAAFWLAETAAFLVETMTDEDWTDSVHLAIFRAIKRLRHRDIAGDPCLLTVELRSLEGRVADEYAERGGAFYVLELAKGQYLIRHCREYCQVVKAATSRRNLAQAAERIRRGIEDGEDVATLTKEAAALATGKGTLRELLGRRTAGARR